MSLNYNHAMNNNNYRDLAVYGKPHINMLKKLEKIDNEIQYKKPFIVGCYSDGRERTFEFLSDDVLKKVMVGHGYFVFIYDKEFYSVSHSWVEGGLFGSFIVRHHYLGEPGVPVTQIDLNEFYPHLADYLTGNINAFQIIADGIIKEYAEGGSPMEKLIRDLNFIREYFETHDGLDSDLRSMLKKMSVANNKFR